MRDDEGQHRFLFCCVMFAGIVVVAGKLVKWLRGGW